MPVSQIDIGAKVGLDRTTVNKVLNRYPNHNIPPKTVARVWKAARELGYDIDRLRKDPERRRYSRTNVNLNVDVTILLADGTVYDSGTGRLRDLSLSGARLINLETTKRSLPIDSFNCRLVIQDPPLKGLALEGVFMRYHMNGSVEFGLTLQNLTNKETDILKDFLT